MINVPSGALKDVRLLVKYLLDPGKYLERERDSIQNANFPHTRWFCRAISKFVKETYFGVKSFDFLWTHYLFCDAKPELSWNLMSYCYKESVLLVSLSLF